MAGYGGEMCGSRRISSVWSGTAPLLRTQKRRVGAGRLGGRVGSTKVVMGQVLGGGEMSSGRSKNAFVFDFLFAFGRLVGDTGWFSA